MRINDFKIEAVKGEVVLSREFADDGTVDTHNFGIPVAKAFAQALFLACEEAGAQLADAGITRVTATEPRLGPGDVRIAETEKENAKAVDEAVRVLSTEPLVGLGEDFPPVDRSRRCMTDGSPEKDPAEYQQIDPSTGQQMGYVALCPAERAKGFVRPVRKTYIHVGRVYEMRGTVLIKADPRACGTRTTMALALAETYARDPGFYSGTFCASCMKHFPLNEFIWEGMTEQVGS